MRGRCSSALAGRFDAARLGLPRVRSQRPPGRGVHDGRPGGRRRGSARARRLGQSAASSASASGAWSPRSSPSRNPEQVERLALLCTSSGGEGGSSYPLQDLLALPEEERAAAGLKLVDSRWDEALVRRSPSRPRGGRALRPQSRAGSGRRRCHRGPDGGPGGARRLGPPALDRLPDARRLRSL